MATNNLPPVFSDDSSFRFKREEELKLYELLGRIIGDGSAQLFRDACYVMELGSSQPPSHKPHLVGHLLREMESSILGVIKPLTEIESDDPCAILLAELGIDTSAHAAEVLREHFKNETLRLNTHSKAKQVRACLELLECKDETLSSRLINSKLHNVAHRKGLSSAAEITDEFREAFFGLVDAYLQLLRLCEASFVLWHRKVDTLLEQDRCPGHLQSQLPRNLALMRYLFDKLDQSGWFEGLWKQGFFEYDATDMRGEWPQAHYLIKIADQLPQEVLDVILSVETNDPWLLRQFCGAAMKMPKEQCEVWAGHLAEHIPVEPANAVSSFMYHLPDFITYLIALGSELAFTLTSVALDILNARYDDSEKFSTRMDMYHYQELLKELIPRLRDLNTRKTADMLGDKLDRAMELGWPSATKDDDSSSAWIPAIEDHSQNDNYYLEGSIALALRNVLEESVKAGGKLDDWLKWLKSRNSLVYVRMSIHLVRRFGSAERIAAWLLQKELFDNSTVLHEYLLLLQHGFPLLDPDGREILLSWIKDFPEYDWVPEEYREQRRNWQQYRRLALIQDSLGQEWKQLYVKLRGEMKEEEDLDRLSFDRWSGGGFVADKPPISPEEVERMEVDELVHYLLGDIPVDDFREITEWGLEKLLMGVVSANPDKYVAKMGCLKNPSIKPFYIRGISTGLVQEASMPVSAEAVLDWIAWCMALPAWQGKPYTRGHDDNKKRLLRYLDGRMGSNAEAPLLMDYREAVFGIIQAAMRDSDPSAEKNLGDHHSQAINSVRGSALDTALNYGLWVKRYIDSESQKGFSVLPELQELLDVHLDVSTEPSPAVRSCYGLYIPQLCWMDKDWVQNNLLRIFPDTPDQAEFFKAAWESYLLYGQCYRFVFEVLAPVYERAVMSEEVTLCVKNDQNSKVRDANMRLCSHLVLFYAWEQISLDEDSMLRRFMLRAAPEYKAEVLRFMGRVLCEEKGLPDKVVSRFVSFHEWWQEAIAPESSKGWKSFGDWFVSPYLDKAWKIKNLVKSSAHTAFSYRSDKVLSELATDYFEEYPLEVLAVTENYIGHQFKRDQRWALDSRDALPDILRLGHHHADEDIRRQANELLGRLVSEGFMKYRGIAEE